MKIENPLRNKYKYLRIGDCFIYKDAIYLKTDAPNKAVSLGTGRLMTVDDDDTAILVNIKAVFE